MKYQTILLACLITAPLALACSNAHAVDAPRSETFTASGMCMEAAYTGALRYRPTGARNISNTDRYVVCSAPADWRTSAGSDAARFISLRVANFSGSSKTITCTLLPGYSSGVNTMTSQGSFPQAEVLEPTSVHWFEWSASELLAADTYFAAPNFSCLMPPDTEVQYLWREWDENVGA